ncbi:MAG TPA: ABC transporter substrate-binding protein [Mycobacterium sp.]|nr:ABC transporter substrate-binding protein [Mycobacterium sp.]
MTTISGARRVTSVRRFALLAAVGCCLALAACTSNTASPGTGGSNTTTAQASAPPCPGPAASGQTVKVGIQWPEAAEVSLPQLGASANAAVDYANQCLGGVGGHPVTVDKCTTDEGNTATATACGNQFVQDKVAAAIVTITAMGATLVPIVTGAGIPYIDSGGTSIAESLDKTGLVFSVSGGTAAVLGAMALQAKNEGIKKVALLTIDSGAAGVQGLAGIPFGKAGVTPDVISVPTGTPDMTPYLQAALSSGAGATVVLGDATLCISYLQAARAIDPTGKHWIISTCIATNVVQAVGATALNGATVFGGTSVNSNDSQTVLYRSVMAKYSPATPIGGFTPTGYQVVMSFIRGMAGFSGNATAVSIADTMKATKNIVSPVGYGTTFGCSTHPLPPLTVCSSQTVVGTMNGANVTNVKLVDAGPLFAG